MEAIEAELEAKSIERDVEVDIKEVEPEPVVEVPPKKTKKIRSEKQIAAFEKARLKRAEGIAARKKLKEEQTEENKQQKKEAKSQGVALQGKPVEAVAPKEQVIRQPAPQPSNPRDQVIQNHYYYYGVPPPDHDTMPHKKKKRPKRPPTPSSSESESEEEYYKDEPPQQEQGQHQQKYHEVPKPSYQFSYT